MLPRIQKNVKTIYIREKSTYCKSQLVNLNFPMAPTGKTNNFSYQRWDCREVDFARAYPNQVPERLLTLISHI